MITLQTNILNILGRLVMVGLAVFLEYLWIHYALKDSKSNHVVFWKLKAGHLIYFLIVIFIFLIVTIICSLLEIIKVQVDKDNDTITFISLFKKKKISTSDIDNYLDTVHSNNLKAFYGIMLNVKNNIRVQLVEQNLKSIPAFRAYLIEKNIPCLGKTRMKYPFN